MERKSLNLKYYVSNGKERDQEELKELPYFGTSSEDTLSFHYNS